MTPGAPLFDTFFGNYQYSYKTIAFAEWGSSFMEDTVHYETLLTSESLAGVRTFIHDGGVQLSCARRGLRCVCR